MIGNDIVDLNLAAVESNWQRKGYLEKIFTPEEKSLVFAAKDAGLMVWLLWSMKESGYKAATDKSAMKPFSPISFRCQNLIVNAYTAKGNVTHDGVTYHCDSTITSDYIHTITAEAPDLLKQAQPKISVYDESDHSYKHSNPVSVSHHGTYLALIYCSDFLLSVS